jgi:hypothetical protein
MSAGATGGATEYRLQRAVGKIVDASGRRPVLVLFLALCALAGTWFFALQVLLNPHTDLRELLPSDSPGLLAFEHQLGRVGGGATLIVVAESPDKASNERFVDDLARRLDAMAAEQKSRGEPPLVSYVESGSKEVRAFFESARWLYAGQKDLESAYDTLDFQIAVRSGLVTDLDDDEPASPPPASVVAAGPAGTPRVQSASPRSASMSTATAGRPRRASTTTFRAATSRRRTGRRPPSASSRSRPAWATRPATGSSAASAAWCKTWPRRPTSPK